MTVRRVRATGVCAVISYRCGYSVPIKVVLQPYVAALAWQAGGSLEGFSLRDNVRVW